MADLLLRELVLQNFMSFGNYPTKIIFTEGRFTVIMGENLDNPSEDDGRRNGVGKSTILESIYYALYGKTLRKGKGKKVVHLWARKNQSTTVELLFEKGDMVYFIERGENPSRVFFLGKKKSDPDDIRARNGKAYKYDLTRNKVDTNKLIQDVIGHDFLTSEYIWTNSANSDTFTELKTAEKQELIEHLFGFAILTHRAEILSEKRKGLKKDLIEKQSQVAANEAANRRIYSQIDLLTASSDEWEENKRKSLEDLERREKLLLGNKPDPDKLKEEIEALIKEYEEEFRENAFFKVYGSLSQDKWAEMIRASSTGSVRVTELRQQKGKLELSLQSQNRTEQQQKDTYAKQVREHEKSKVRLEMNLRDLVKNMEKEENRFEELTNQLEALTEDTEVGKCPTCNQDWHEHTEEKRKADLAKIEKEMEALLSSLGVAETRKVEYENELINLKLPDPPQTIDKSDLISSIKELEGEIEKTEIVNEQYQVVIDAVVELEKKTREIGNLEKKRIEWDRNLNTIEVERKQKVAAQNPYPDQIESLKKNALVDLGDSKREVEELEILIENHTFLIELLTKKDSFLRKKIIDNWLLKLNHKMFQYGKILGLEHTVRFDSEMDLVIFLDDKEMDLTQISRGEEARVNLAIYFSFQDCFEAMNFRTNVMFVDERLDNAIDPQAANAALDVMRSKTKDKHVFLITHRIDLSDQVSDVMIVQKEHKQSKLVWS